MVRHQHEYRLKKISRLLFVTWRDWYSIVEPVSESARSSAEFQT